MKIIDCFIIDNEIEMLYYRLHLLYSIVDYFIIIEARQNFFGKSKPTFVQDNMNLFDKFKDKIIHLIVDLPYEESNIDLKNNKSFQQDFYNENGEQWMNQAFQTEVIRKEALKYIPELNDEDLLIVSEIEEIPDPDTISLIKQNNEKIMFTKLIQDVYYYNLNGKQPVLWRQPYIVSIFFLNKYAQYFDINRKHKFIYFNSKYKHIFNNEDRLLLTELRYTFDCDLKEKGGWYLKHFGDINFIKDKLKNNNDEDIQKILTDNSITSIKTITNLPPLYDTFLKRYFSF